MKLSTALQETSSDLFIKLNLFSEIGTMRHAISYITFRKKTRERERELGRTESEGWILFCRERFKKLRIF
jgi:hypothetical protein